MTPARLRTVTARELMAALERLGFERRASGGTSHVRFVHPDGKRTTVPVHPGQDIGRGLLRKILRDIDMSLDDLERWL